MPISSNTINWTILNSTDIIPADKAIRVDMRWDLGFTSTPAEADVRRILSDSSAAFDVVTVYIDVTGVGGFLVVKRKQQYKSLTVDGLRLQITMLMGNESDTLLFGLTNFQVTGIYVEAGAKEGPIQQIEDAAKKAADTVKWVAVAIIIIAGVYLFTEVKQLVPKVGE